MKENETIIIFFFGFCFTAEICFVISTIVIIILQTCAFVTRDYSFNFNLYPFILLKNIQSVVITHFLTKEQNSYS